MFDVPIDHAGGVVICREGTLIDIDMLKTLAAAGATVSVIIAAVEKMNESAVRKRKADAERLRRKRGEADLFDVAAAGTVPQVVASADPEITATVAGVARQSATERDIKERKVSTPSKERNNTTPRDTHAREDAKSCLITAEAFDLADAIGAEAGHTAATWPPGWCGAAGYVQRFLNEGCTPALIRMACTSVLRRGRGAPEYFAYFCKPIMDMKARLEAPLPQVKPRLEVIDGGRSRAQAAPIGHKPGPLQAACEQLRAELRRQSGPAGACPDASGDAVRVLPAQ